MDTTRESVERLIALYSRDHGNPTFGEKGDTVAALRALLTRAEAAEAERDAAMTEALSLAKTLHANHYSDVHQWEPFDYPAEVISQIDNMVAGIIESAKAERDALQAKLALAVGALKISRETHCGIAEHILQGGKNTKGIFSDSQTARLSIDKALATLTADTPKEGKP